MSEKSLTELRRIGFQFYNELGKKYPEEKIVYSEPWAQYREKVLSNLIENGEETLDIGCNRGRYSAHVGDKYVGLDPAIGCLQHFRKQRIRGVAEALPFKNESFETILLFETLEHVWERNLVLDECKRILKIKGKLIVSAPYGHDPWQMIWEEVLGKFGVEERKYLHGGFNEPYFKNLLKDWLIEKMQILYYTCAQVDGPIAFTILAVARKQ